MQPIAFATALAAASAIFAVVLILLRVVAPQVFVVVFNSQFFGADVAFLLPLPRNDCCPDRLSSLRRRGSSA
jgi:hypothetical protein